jgi:hypothetical protein
MTRVLALTALLVSASAFAGYEVSSFRKEDKLGKNYWNAASALDSKMETCWQIDAEAQNEGSWIAIDTPGGEVDKLAMVIGWQKDDETFQDYARVKKARVEIYDSGKGTPVMVAETTVEFEDKPGWQIVELPDTKVGGEVFGGRVKVSILETYPGKDFPSLAVSEVRVHLKEFPAENIGFGSTLPDTEADGHDGGNLIDGNVKTFWVATKPEAKFSVKAGGYGLASLGIHAGPKSHGRPKTVKIMANQAEVTHTLEDKPGELQWVLLPCLVGYTGGAWGDVEVQVIDTYPGDTTPNVAIAEVKLNAASIEEF